jgi:hypothetical protein
MARTIHTIEAVASSASMEVDRDEGIIRGVKILGLVSDNNRKYLPEAVRKAKSLYEGIKVNINHPAESGDVRNAEDRFGKLINVKYVEGEGLYGDLMFLKSHPMAERICEAAERNDMNDTFGLSHNAQGDGQEDKDGCFVVSSIVEVRHVDLVADPATTKSLREARMKVKEANSSDTFVCKIYKDFGGPYGKTGPKTIKEQSVSGSKEKAIAWVKSQLKSTPIKDDEQGKDYTIFGVVLRKGSGAIVAKYEKSETGSSIITHAESKGASMKEATDFDAIKRFQDSLKNATTKQVLAYHINNTGGKIKSQNYTAGEVGGKQAMIGDILRAKFGDRAVEEFFAQEKSSKTKRTKEADTPDDEDEIMTEADDMPVEDEEMTEASGGILGPIMKEITSNVSKAKEAIKTAKAQGATVRQKIKGSLGAKITAELNRVLYAASGALDTLAMQIHTMETDPTWAGEGTMPDDEDEIMTEAEDMPVDDPSEEEMTEAGDSGKQEYAAKVKPLVQKADSLASEARQKLHDASMIVSNLSNHVPGKQLKKYLNDIGNLLSDSKQKCFDAEKSLSAAKSGNWDIDESINDEDEMMPEADDMPVDEADDELAIEAEDDYTEEEYSDDEDKMAMESKRRLRQFCKANGVVLTEGLLKDLKPLTEAAQRRCILRIKLASKARKPKSSGSMMPMTESKVHTGDNVFNWLRS